MRKKKIYRINELDLKRIYDALNSCTDNYGSEASDNGEFAQFYDSKKIEKALAIMEKLSNPTPQ